MATFFYFVPERNTLVPAEAAELGLAYAFERGIDCRQVTGNGPEGQQGIVCAEQDSYKPGQLAYVPRQQSWRQIPGSSVWVGRYKNELPGPDDLARKRQLDGELLELDDGRAWQVPIARTHSERMTDADLEIVWELKLPQRLELSADGKWTAGVVTLRYAGLWELAEAWLRIRLGEATAADTQRFDSQGEIDATVLALQTNYRLGRVEASMLGLLNDVLCEQILDTLIDLKQFIRLVKKKAELLAKLATTTNPNPTEAAGSALCAGPAGSTTITDPALQTSTT